jgi:fatty acid desaturase
MRNSWALVDFLCFVRAALLVALVVSGVRHWTYVPLLYSLAVGSLAMNFLRVLGLHEYRGAGGEMSYLGQIEDSITIPGHPLFTEIIFPLGLRYHALHHMFPGLPYHNLGFAHRRLISVLPADSPYPRTVHPSYLSVLRKLRENIQSPGASR